MTHKETNDNYDEFLVNYVDVLEHNSIDDVDLTYKYTVADDYFADGGLDIDIEFHGGLDSVGSGLMLNGNLAIKVVTKCDRCGKATVYEAEKDCNILIKFSQEGDAHTGSGHRADKKADDNDLSLGKHGEYDKKRSKSKDDEWSAMNDNDGISIDDIDDEMVDDEDVYIVHENLFELKDVINEEAVCLLPVQFLCKTECTAPKVLFGSLEKSETVEKKGQLAGLSKLLENDSKEN